MKSDLLLTPILADEVSTGGVIVGSGVASTLLLFFGETATVMLPFFCVALLVIIVDLIFGIRAAKTRGEAIRISRALRRTLGKTVEYLCWCVLAASLAVATGIKMLASAMVLVVIGIELISIAQNWYFAKYGKKVQVDVLKVGAAVVESKTGVDVRGAVKLVEPEKKAGQPRGKNGQFVCKKK